MDKPRRHVELDKQLAKVISGAKTVLINCQSDLETTGMLGRAGTSVMRQAAERGLS